MKRPLFYFLLFTFSFLITCTSSKKNEGHTEIAAKDIPAFGRTEITNDKLELISSASHFSFSFKGKECIVHASLSNWNDHNYLQYELDGVYQKRIRLSKEPDQRIVITAPKDGIYTVTIFKATEAHTGPIFIEKITGDNLQLIKPADAPLIEFIGNSITCGAAADPSEIPCGQGEYHDQHNAYYAYGPRVARNLKTNFIVSGVSGIGIYRNWNSPGPVMPQVYEKTDFQPDSPRNWDFTLYRPTVVSIALGTNDFSGGDGRTARLPFDSSSFVKPYIEFVKMVKSKYPAAQIALLSSPMINGNNRILLQNCLSAVKNRIDSLYPSDKPVALHFFKPMRPSGCTGHPSVEDHAVIAAELVPFFKNLLQ